MKVNLAAQTLSSSVADSLMFCVSELKLPQFTGCEATVKFIKMVDQLFDILNSRNPFGKGSKSPLRRSNEDMWLPFLAEAKAYILGLTDNTSKPMYSTKRKTAFVGLLCDIHTVEAVYTTLVKEEPCHLKYLLTYKLSQDHIELFFGAVRASLGCNNNPTVRQFTATYKRLLMRHNIESGNGNVTAQDATKLLNANTDSIVMNNLQTDTLDVSLARRYDFELRTPVQSDHDYSDVPNFGNLSNYKMSVVTYMAGYVVKMVRLKIHCPDCLTALTDDVPSDTLGLTFLKFKKSRRTSTGIDQCCTGM